jgi:hypothetical protein
LLCHRLWPQRLNKEIHAQINHGLPGPFPNLHTVDSEFEIRCKLSSTESLERSQVQTPEVNLDGFEPLGRGGLANFGTEYCLAQTKHVVVRGEIRIMWSPAARTWNGNANPAAGDGRSHARGGLEMAGTPFLNEAGRLRALRA